MTRTERQIVQSLKDILVTGCKPEDVLELLSSIESGEYLRPAISGRLARRVTQRMTITPEEIAMREHQRALNATSGDEPTLPSAPVRRAPSLVLL